MEYVNMSKEVPGEYMMKYNCPMILPSHLI